MKILATSDLHGDLPPIAECDLLLIGGDVCPIDDDHHPETQRRWIESRFQPWLHRVPAKRIVGIAGNHDFVFEKMRRFIDEMYLPWTYLQDSQVEIEGLTIYGLPWIPNLPRWAFYGNKALLKEKYDAIPKDVDIVLSHGPPYGLGDRYSFNDPFTGEPQYLGCKSATDMLARVQPKALVCGHIHEGYGLYTYRHRNGGFTDVYNVSHMDETYTPRRWEGGVEIIIDAVKEQTEPECEVCDPTTDTRSSQERPA